MKLLFVLLRMLMLETDDIICLIFYNKVQPNNVYLRKLIIFSLEFKKNFFFSRFS